MPRPRAIAALRELPLAAGVAVGLFVAWRYGWAFVFDGALEGYHWEDYLEAAWMVVHQQDLGYPNYRQPLHAAVVGHLGEALGSYATAGALVSSLSVVALIAAAGLGGRALAGPAAGGAAAALLPMTQVTLSSPRWSNLYPMLAGTSSLSLAAAAAVARWPCVPLALLAGVAGGVAWGVDARGLAFAPAASLLVLVGAARAKGWGRRLALVVAFAAPLSLGPLSKQALWLDGVVQPEPIEQLRFQRKVFLRWAIQGHREAGMKAPCEQEDAAELPSFAAMRRPCAQRMAAFNFRSAFPRHLPVPVGLAVAGAALCLLPRRRGRPWTALEAPLALGVGLAPLLVLAWWMPYPDRYLLQLAVPFALLAPVGLGRAVGLLTPRRWAGAMASGLLAGLVAWSWSTDPNDRFENTALEASPWERTRQRVAASTQQRMGPGDTLLDCADLHTPTRWLPRLTADPPMMRLDDGRCAAWIAQPEGDATAWLLLHEHLPPRVAPGQHIDLQAALARWEVVWELEAVRLLRWRGPSGAEEPADLPSGAPGGPGGTEGGQVEGLPGG